MCSLIRVGYIFNEEIFVQRVKTFPTLKTKLHVFEIVNITSNRPKYPNITFIKSVLMRNGYKKFDGDYFHLKKMLFFLF